MKICSVCKQTLVDSKFSISKKRKDGLSADCKECHKIYAKAHYEKNKKAYIAKNTQNKQNKATEWLAYKAALSCSICGEHHPACLDFHHVDGSQKENTAGYLARDGSKEALALEIAKCIVLCANCHRKHHYDKRQ